MHDIGKIAIPDSILLKPGRLTTEEFEIMKEHTIRGCKIINSASVIQDEEYYMYCYDICRHHHERYDGNGYPDGLKGEEISIVAQVVSVVDVYDALISRRCYKEAYDEEKVFEMILNGECGVFNPKLIECLKEVRTKLKRLYWE
jgi:putative two-component system response regulator